MTDQSAIAALQAENARLIALLEAHDIEWRPPQPAVRVAREPESLRFSTAEKVTLFMRLFRGRMDVFPIRWEGKTSGKSGYAPACANEWRSGICEKPRIKCGDCTNRLLIPLSDAVIYDHLAGKHTVGVYPMLEDDTCYFLAADFDEADWRDAPGLSCSRVKSSVFPLRWKFRDQAMGRTSGYSLPAAFPPVRPDVWARQSSAIPALGHGN